MQDSLAVFHPCYLSNDPFMLSWYFLHQITLGLFVQLILLPLLPHFCLHPRAPHAWFLLPSVFSRFFLPPVPLGLSFGDCKVFPLLSSSAPSCHESRTLQWQLQVIRFCTSPSETFSCILSLADPFRLLYSQDLTSFLHVHAMESLSAPLKWKIIIATHTTVSVVSSLPHFHQPPTPVGSVLQKMSTTVQSP